MQKGKFVLNFVAIYALLFFIVWAGTAFDNEMTFSWYSYMIVGVLSFFYAWTKSVDLNQISTPAEPPHHHVAHHHAPAGQDGHPHHVVHHDAERPQ